jgi:hypothetical protein
MLSGGELWRSSGTRGSGGYNINVIVLEYKIQYMKRNEQVHDFDGLPEYVRATALHSFIPSATDGER